MNDPEPSPASPRSPPARRAPPTSGEMVAIEEHRLEAEPPPEAAGQPSPEDKALRDEIDHLQAAAEKASGHVRNLYLFFLSFGLYLAIIFGSTTHEQLLRENPVTLPLFDVELPLRGFFWVAPALFVLLHFNLLVQCYLLAGKMKHLDSAIRALHNYDLEVIERARLDVFPFTQMLLGEHRQLPGIMTWVTMAMAPVVLLLFGQASFLPYHDVATTWWHRTLVVLDLAVLWLLWPIATDLSGRWGRRLRAWWRLVRRRDTAILHGRRVPLAILWLVWSRFRRSPAAFTRLSQCTSRRYVSNQGRRWRPLLLEKLGAVAVAAAFLLLAIPGEFLALPLDLLVGQRGGLGIVSRNLVVRETNLVGSWPTQAQIDQFGEDLAWQNFGAPPNLRERDLRYAELSQSIFMRGDLRGANLQGALLRNANLQGANLGCANADPPERCADLQDAVLGGANLQGAGLGSANLQGAGLINADLQSADLHSANLQDALLLRANLQGAHLQSANLLSADLYEANLQGADLANAKLTATTLAGANFKGAHLEHAALDGVRSWCMDCVNFQGADLRNANLQGAVLRGVNLQGANLRNAFLWGASLQGAELEGTDLRGASLWHATVDPDAALYRFSDLRGLDLELPTAEEWEDWSESAEALSHDNGRERLLFVWRELHAAAQEEQEGGTPERPKFPSSLSEMEEVLFEQAPLFAAFDAKLANFLIGLACSHDAPPSIAHNIARRAVDEREDGRLYPRLVAQALLGDDCAPANELPDALHKKLDELAVQSNIRQ